MKKFILLSFCVLCTGHIFAQRKLVFTQRPSNTYTQGHGKNASVTFSTPLDLPTPLFYTTSMSIADPKTEAKRLNEEMFYNLIYDVVDENWTNRIKVVIPGYEPLIIDKLNFQPNMQYHFYIHDPEFVLVDCYRTTRREGDKLFGVCNYEGAKDRFNEVKNCKNVSKDSIFYINKKIEDIDSILVWKKTMNDAEKKHDYKKVHTMCENILYLNSEDKVIKQRMYDVKYLINNEKQHCKIDFDVADAYRKEKDYDKAAETYQKIIDSDCNDRPLAVKKLYALDGYKYLPQVLTYEWELNTAIGFSVGKYMSNRKVRGYFTLRFAPSLFEMIRHNVRPNKNPLRKPEFDVSFGLTKKIVRPIWIFFGAGYTGVIKTTSPADAVKQKYQLMHAASPEIGIMLKVPFSKKIGMALRYTFQYRFAIKKDDIKEINKMNHVVGLGVCF